MIPGQLIAPGLNFTSVHDLTPVTVHISFSMFLVAGANFEVTFLDSRPIFMVCALKSCFLKYFKFIKKYLIDFFYSVSNFGPGMVQLKYQKAKRLKFSFLVL